MFVIKIQMTNPSTNNASARATIKLTLRPWTQCDQIVWAKVAKNGGISKISQIVAQFWAIFIQK